jgi:hypothetical protein
LWFVCFKFFTVAVAFFGSQQKSLAKAASTRKKRKAGEKGSPFSIALSDVPFGVLGGTAIQVQPLAAGTR